MQITATTNIDEVLAAIEAIEQKASNMTPLMGDIANHLFNLADEALENERAPDGSAWQPLAPATVAAKGHDRRLHDTGHLRDTLDYDSDSHSATVGTNAVSSGGQYPYPAVQQFGTEDDHIPARRFMPFSDQGDLMDEAKDDLINLVQTYFAA